MWVCHPRGPTPFVPREEKTMLIHFCYSRVLLSSVSRLRTTGYRPSVPEYRLYLFSSSSYTRTIYLWSFSCVFGGLSRRCFGLAMCAGTPVTRRRSSDPCEVEAVSTKDKETESYEQGNPESRSLRGRNSREHLTVRGRRARVGNERHEWWTHTHTQVPTKSVTLRFRNSRPGR